MRFQWILCDGLSKTEPVSVIYRSHGFIAGFVESPVMYHKFFSKCAVARYFYKRNAQCVPFLITVTSHKMKKIIQFGENVAGYNIPVLNEREIRAAAGIMFLVIYTGLMLIIFNGDFRLVKYVIALFLIDFSVRVFINPKFSPSLIIGRLIVSNQVPEYVGAQQKKFAWIIGVILSASSFVLLIVMNATGPFTGIICFLCLIFLFFESAFGICLACRLYRLMYGEKAQYCPGEVCDVKARQPIQKTSGAQLTIVFAFIALIFLMVRLFSPIINVPPHDIFQGSTAKSASK